MSDPSRSPDATQTAFDEAVDAVRRLAAEGRDPTPEEIASLFGDGDGIDLAKLLRAFELQAGEAGAARDSPGADTSNEGLPRRLARAERAAPTVSAEMSEDDLPSLRPMGWIVLAGEISVAAVLVFLLAPSLLNEPYGRIVEPLTRLLPNAAAQPVAQPASARRDTITHPPFEQPPSTVRSVAVAATPAVMREESADVPAPSLPPIETVRFEVPSAGKVQSALALPEDEEPVVAHVAVEPSSSARAETDKTASPVIRLEQSPGPPAPEPPPQQSPAREVAILEPVAPGSSEPEPSWEVADGPSGAAPEAGRPIPIDDAASPAPPVSDVASHPDDSTPSMAANRSVESPLEAGEAGASGDAPMPPPAPLASELTSIAPDPSTTSALTGPSPTSSKQATDLLTEPFSASTMRAAELAEALAAERKQALEREMERADSLARELAQIREEVSALRNRSRHGWTSFPALPLPLLAPVDPAPPAASQEASKIVQPSFQRPESPAQTFAPTAEVHTRPKMPPPADSATATVAQAAPPVPSAAGPPVAIAAPPLPEMVRAAPAPALQPHAPAPSGHQRLLDRATALIKAHDISGARLVLERAVSEGSVEATHLLAQTYDPRMLKLWAVVGLPGDAVRADELYARARAAGMRVPPGRIVRN